MVVRFLVNISQLCVITQATGTEAGGSHPFTIVKVQESRVKNLPVVCKWE